MIFAIGAATGFALLLAFICWRLVSRRGRLALAVTGKSRAVTLFTSGERASYTGRRMLVSASLLGAVLIALVVGAAPAISGTLQNVSSSLGFTISGNNHDSNALNLVAHSEPQTASTQVKRISFHAADQFDTQFQLEDWGPSACSGISMTVVMNAYGHQVRVVDVVQKEIALGVWDHNLGLLREDGIRMTADAFGFNTDGSHKRSLSDIIAIANGGKPVIVGVFDYAHFPTGHFIVVSGGDEQYVTIADSSDFNFQHMTHELFLSMWQNFSAVLTPK